VESLPLDRPPVLIGHSLGGWLSLHYALRHPDRVRALALIAPFYTDRQLSPWLRLARRRPLFGGLAMRGIPEWAVHTVLGWDPASARFSPEARRQIAQDYKRASPNIFYLTRDFYNLTRQLSAVTVPTLVIWGDNDLTLRPAYFPRLVEALPGGRAYVLPGCGHQPHIGHPGQVNRAILDFLKELDGEGQL
jgi:pimeloyl-ACP methyl ester carboxylesterase